ncbi:MAG: helix-turn-helix domain-containing protein [Nitrospira sp.]|nr:helix-turn-helix domain-containing protein [Nitrospira sp.]
MREICLCCGYAIPEAIGRRVPCSAYHVRCAICEWPVARSHLSPKGLCEVCQDDQQRREADRMIEEVERVSSDRGLRWRTERELILRTLAEKNGNRTQAAKALGICVRTMRNKLREYRAMGIPC